MSRADVAAVCVAALSNPKARNVTLELSNDTKLEATRNNINQIFDSMKPNIYE